MTGSSTATSIAGQSEVVPGFEEFGIRAFTTSRATGSFGLQTDEPVGVVMGRWSALRRELRSSGPRFATASQVHGATVLEHRPGWTGWLRADDADGHMSMERGTAVAVTIVYSGVMSFILLKLIGLVIPLRASREDEETGLDLSYHGEEAYVHGESTSVAWGAKS